MEALHSWYLAYVVFWVCPRYEKFTPGYLPGAVGIGALPPTFAGC